MLKTLRWKLTFIYLLTSLGLVSLISTGAYSLIRYFFQQTTDKALQYKMVIEFKELNLRIPTELENIQHLWLESHPHPFLEIPGVVNPTEPESDELDELLAVHASSIESETNADDQYDARLSPVFVIPIDSNGNPMPNAKKAPPPIAGDEEAFTNALQNGVDWRTIRLPDGNRVRLLTYSAPKSDGGPAVIQVGRVLEDQDNLLSQYLTGLLVLGSATCGLLALISWWLAGRSLGPAQQAWDRQQQFIANASHELRTPLTLLRANADYALRENSSEAQQTALQDILEECDYMSRLVDDLLLLSRLDAKRLAFTQEIISIPELLADISRQVEKLFLEKSVSLTFDSIQGKILGDRTCLRQVLLILLDNTLRFTPPGSAIHLTSRSKGRMMEICISDNGVGIPPEHLPHLFDRFYQAGASSYQDYRSSGLGLSIAKTLIEAQKGTIRIDSQLGKGTQVTLSLPPG